MSNLFKILFLYLLIIGCASDVNSEDILASDDSGNGNGGGFTGGGNETIPELNVELITTYNEQTASFSTSFGNYQRSFIVHVPPNFDFQTQCLPLVFVLHGYWGEGADMLGLFEEQADEHGFVVCYPNGLQDNYGANHWNSNFNEVMTTVDDIGFLSNLGPYQEAIPFLS